MIDLIFSAGQAFSASGLADGGFLSLTYRAQAVDPRDHLAAAWN
jgi:hypothetical protein